MSKQFLDSLVFSFGNRLAETDYEGAQGEEHFFRFGGEEVGGPCLWGGGLVKPDGEGGGVVGGFEGPGVGGTCEACGGDCWGGFGEFWGCVLDFCNVRRGRRGENLGGGRGGRCLGGRLLGCGGGFGFPFFVLTCFGLVVLCFERMIYWMGS